MGEGKRRRKIQGIPQNLEEQAISLVGTDVYQKLIKGYTEKQWGRNCKDLPAFIIKRLPVRYIYDNNYYKDRYQGIPIGGYTNIINKLLEKCNIELNVDFNKSREIYQNTAEKIVYTGPIDEYFNFKYSVVTLTPIRKKSFVQNYINDYTKHVETKISKRLEKGLREAKNPQKQVSRELLLNPKYLVEIGRAHV